MNEIIVDATVDKYTITERRERIITYARKILHRCGKRNSTISNTSIKYDDEKVIIATIYDNKEKIIITLKLADNFTDVFNISIRKRLLPSESKSKEIYSISTDRPGLWEEYLLTLYKKIQQVEEQEKIEKEEREKVKFSPIDDSALFEVL